jgi:hypothetical protein
VIHAFALEPRLVATWGKPEAFRFIADKFGLGTPRVLLELPAFPKWTNQVCEAGVELNLEGKDWTRLAEIFRMFGEHRCRRSDALYKDINTWLQNAEREHDRREFRAIVATENPRSHRAIVLGDDLGAAKARLWTCSSGATPSRTPAGTAAALKALLVNSKEVHLVDPYFSPQKVRNRMMLEALTVVVAARGDSAPVVRVICARKMIDIGLFEAEAAQMALGLPLGISIQFIRLEEKLGGERLHNRYVLTDLGGVSLGIGLDAGGPGETDDLNLLTRDQYVLRWSQYVGSGAAFATGDAPKTIVGSMARRANQGSRGQP